MASNDSTPLPKRVASAFSKLSAVAVDLNAASDELGKTITQIDTALKKLSLGVIVWVTFASRGDDPDEGSGWQEADQIGYAKVNGQWGMTIRTIGENVAYPEQGTNEEWLFNDAPRALRLKAIDKIPEFLDALASMADQTTQQIRNKLKAAQDVADAVTIASGGRLPLRGGLTPPPRVGGAK